MDFNKQSFGGMRFPLTSSRDRSLSDLGRISKRLAADPEIRQLREKMAEKVAKARKQLEQEQRRPGRGSANWRAARP